MPISSKFRTVLCAAAIAASSIPMLIGCFSADFIAYDDSEHIANHAYAGSTSALDFFVPKENTSYIPLAFISYKLDRFIWEPVFGKWLGSWAPGVRLDNWLLHTCAALILWQLLLALKFSPRQSFFIALIFACHPLACETVCWVSERKNALTAMFGFAALWTLALERRPSWRWPMACVLYLLALLGKPSALGLLPLLIAVECLQIVPVLRERFGLLPAAPINKGGSTPGLGALCALAGLCVWLNLFTHSKELVPPPGGSAFTALLTDLNIFSRYLFNLVLAPAKLSAVYFVEPITGLGDPRAWLWGAVLLGTAALTVALARNRMRAIFGWFWFFAALGPNANVISIVHVMADRYMYLATPGALILLSETLAGISERLMIPRSIRTAVPSIAICALVFLSFQRGKVWNSTLNVFEDAVTKQPGAFYAHYGLAGAYDTIWHNAPKDSVPQRYYEERSIDEFKMAFNCSDSSRYLFKHDVALILGQHYFKIGDGANAQKYLSFGAQPALSPSKNETRAMSLALLAIIDWTNKSHAEALKKAQDSLALFPTDPGRLAFAKASIALAKSADATEKRARLDAAQAKLADIPRNSGYRPEADELLGEIQKQ